jgi:uncharacterized membrane protein YjdF
MVQEKTKTKKVILLFNIIYLIIFAVLFLINKNYEFLAYIAFMFILIYFILKIDSHVNFSNMFLISLTMLGILHMLGGHLIINGTKLYGYGITPELRFDKIIHFFGSIVATLGLYELLADKLKLKLKENKSLSFIVFLGGIGIGAIYEILEFSLVLILPETGVGGYFNTMGDLVADSLGALFAIIWIKAKILKDK